MDNKAYWSAVAFVVVALLLADFLEVSGRTYCAVRHPVEALTTSRTACEQQHVIQQQHGGGHVANVIWINTSEHDYSDRSRNAPWEVAHDGLWGDWGDDNLKRAYKMGVYANGYHFMVYDYGRGGDATMTLFEWDGASHVTYMVGSVFNFITKELSYAGYQLDRDGDASQLSDAILGVFIDLAEVAIGLGYGALGVVVGTVFNPIDTVGNLLGMVVYSVESAAVGLWNTVADILSLITLGWAQVQTANW